MAVDAWLGLSLVTVCAWGLGTFVSKPATTRLGVRRMLAFVGIGEGLLYFGLFLAFRTEAGPQTPFVWLVALLAGVTGTLGYVFYYEGILEGTVGVMGTVTAAYPVPTILLALLLLGETLDLLQGAGVILVVGCVLLLSWQPKAHRKDSSSVVVFALLAFLSWGLWGYFAKVAVDAIGDGNLFGFYALANTLVIGGFLLATRKQEAGPAGAKGRRASGLGILDVVAGATGVVSVTLAYALGPASLVSSVTGTYPVVSTLAAATRLHERFGWRQAVALTLFVPGILLIAF